MRSKQPIMKKYGQLLVTLFSLLLSLSVISCDCNGPNTLKQDEEPSTTRELSSQSGGLNMDVVPTDLMDYKKTTKVIFTATDKANPTDLSQFKLQIDFMETRGTGNSITYIDGRNESKKITNSFQESVSHFFSVKELQADKNPIKLAFTLVPDPVVTSMYVTFKLLDKNDKPLKEYTVNWKKAPIATAQLKFTKLAYDPVSGIVTYIIQNSGTAEAKDVQLRYTNISIDDTEKTALINNQQTGTINFASISPQGSTNEQTLPINFKTATKAKFRFEILHKDQGKFIEELTREEEFSDKAPQLKLTPITFTKLVGANKSFQFKIEKEVGSGNIDPSKLKLIITNDLDTSAVISYKGTYVKEISGTELDTIDNISLTITPFLALKTSFTVQLNYESKNIGNSQTFTWEIDAKRAAKALLKAISTNKNNENEMKIKELLQVSGIDINTQDKSGYSPLHLAVKLCNQALITTLLAKGANVNTINNQRATPLHTAIEKGDQASIKALLTIENINLNAKDRSGKTPLHRAILEGNKEAIKMLIEKGANINAKDYHDNTPLHTAAQSGNQAIIEMLLNTKGIDVNAKNENDQTPLHIAAESGDRTTIEALLNAKDVDINTKDSNGNTPLYLAVLKENQTAIEILVAKGSHATVENKYGYSSISRAIREKKNEAIVALLAAKDIDVKAKDTEGDTLLHYVATRWKKGTKVVIEALVAQGADVNTKNNLGYTPLHIASKEGGSVEVIETLIAQGTDVNVMDNMANTPLHLAIKESDLEIVKLLLNLGARRDIEDRNKKTPLDLAQESTNVEIKKLFGIITS
jgi:ankyrin repeat protein